LFQLARIITDAGIEMSKYLIAFMQCYISNLGRKETKDKTEETNPEKYVHKMVQWTFESGKYENQFLGY